MAQAKGVPWGRGRWGGGDCEHAFGNAHAIFQLNVHLSRVLGVTLRAAFAPALRPRPARLAAGGLQCNARDCTIWVGRDNVIL